ncbi:hypothetical protein SAMN05428989_2236 [Pseudoxanthomonas sp. GM95]|uniref:hypothetical protein n=1 Tax=Pseudoxanthomonas sp. GM95 TaxID=1881043 RepID=UPI0008B300D8|nr:hypothetical protein [Pseudoxanthomonas sp. GM95]SEL68418.1 hypothetical protein SAMN05428989_2236 [Pseudoxanthomonas sp. GM95]
MTPRARFNLVMGLLVLAAVAFGLWRWRQQASSAAVSAQIAARVAQARSSTEDRNRVDTAREERGLPASPPASTAPLPPWGEPLGANFDTLRRRADAGDAQAACRIGVELSLCNLSQITDDLPIENARVEALKHGASLGQADAAADAARQQVIARDRGFDGYCQGLDTATLRQAASYLRKAALAGNRDAMLRYATGPFFNKSNAFLDQHSYLQDPVFADWYREAVPMLQRALHAGDPMAVQLLADAYASDGGLLNALVPDDPTQAYSYQLLLSYLSGGPAPAAGTLDARQRADAEHQAQRLYRESFDSHPAKAPIPRDLTLQPDNPAAAPCR